MKRVCAWCNKTLADDSRPNGDSDNKITHGICPSCSEFFLSCEPRTLNEFLNELAAPVLVVDEERVVLFANKRAREFLGTDRCRVNGFRGGDALECAHSRLPEGCGRTVHCKTCAIRKSVEETVKTGKSVHDVPATVSRQSNDTTREIRFRISTENVNNVVLLRIEEVD